MIIGELIYILLTTILIGTYCTGKEPSTNSPRGLASEIPIAISSDLCYFFKINFFSVMGEILFEDLDYNTAFFPVLVTITINIINV